MILRLILFSPVIALLVLFGLSNRQPAAFRLWPFDISVVAPLSYAVLALSAVAFLLGAFVAWTAGMATRRRARRLAEAADLLEAELIELRGQVAKDIGSSAVPPRPVPGTALRLHRSAA